MFDDYPEALKQLAIRYEKLFGVQLQNWSQSGNRLGVGLPTSNSGFKKSKYYLEPGEQIFSHLTSYNKLFSILNSGKIRLYNLKNSNDPNELFLVKRMSPRPQVVEKLKESVFIFSFCSKDALSNSKLWGKYGTVALNFEITNPVEQWHEFRFSKMYYENTPIAERYIDMIEQLQREFPDWSFQEDYGSLISLHAFHKQPEHAYEQEIRILYLPHLFSGDIEQHFDFKVGDYHTGFTEYIELPLFFDPNARPFVVRKNVTRHNNTIDRDENSFPTIRITSIQFGDNEERVTQKKLSEMAYELEDYLEGKFGYRIEVVKELFSTGLLKKGCLSL